MPQPLTAEALETPKTRQGAKVLPLHEEQPSRPAPVTSGTPEPGDALDDMAEILDRGVHAGIARLTFGLSPAALADAYMDWAAHLAISPGKQVELSAKAPRKWARLAQLPLRCCVSGGHASRASSRCPRTAASPERVAAMALQFHPPGFLLQQQWWHNATTGIDGVTRQHEDVVEFASRQILDMASPSNFLATNPVVQRRICRNGRPEPRARASATSWRIGSGCSATSRPRARRHSRSGATSRSRPAR